MCNVSMCECEHLDELASHKNHLLTTPVRLQLCVHVCVHACVYGCVWVGERVVLHCGRIFLAIASVL